MADNGKAGNVKRAALLIAVTLIAACSEGPKPPVLSDLYSRVAEIKEARRPVVTIPGMLGSRLVDEANGVVGWGGADRLSADPSEPDEARSIGLPIGDGTEPLSALRDTVRPDGVVRVAHASLLGVTLDFDIYSGIINTLIAGGYDFRKTRLAEQHDRHTNLDAFEFPYDWRRDIVEAAKDLDAFLERKAEQVTAERMRVLGAPGDPVRFDLVAHSMGALVARYYLMYGAQDLPADGGLPVLNWAGARRVDRAVLIAPPFSGSILALENLVNGRSFGLFQDEYPSALTGTFPATYELLPRVRHDRIRGADGKPLLGLFDVQTWVENRWGLADPDQDDVLATLMPDVADKAERRRRALAHLAAMLARAEQFQRAIDQPNAPPPGLDLFLVVGGGILTPAEGSIDPKTRKLRIDTREEGDGVVLRASALADERQGATHYSLGLDSPHGYRSVLFLPDEHVELTRSPVFGDNLLFWLLEGEKAPGDLRLAGDSGHPVGDVLRRIPIVGALAN